MDNNLPPPPPTRLTQLITLIRTHPKTKLVIVSLALITLITSITSILLGTRTLTGFRQDQLVFPSPSPKIPSQFASHPIILDATAAVATATADLRQLIITNHPLMPPSLDTKVTLVR